MDIKNSFGKIYPNVELIKIQIEDYLEEFIEKNYQYDIHSKIYGLQPDGNIGTFHIGDWNKIKQFNMIERMGRSLSLSPNIYVFILLIDMWAKKNNHVIIGYRPMKRYVRRSYNFAIKRLQIGTCIEPKNLILGDVLDGISSKLSVEERSNIGVLKAFNNFCIENNTFGKLE